MADHVILLAPSANRVYAADAGRLGRAELAVLLGPTGASVSPLRLAGVDYLQVAVDPLDDSAAAVLGRLSGFFAAYRREADLLRPVPVGRPDLLEDDLVTIPKYAGKTNEQFTRLLLNVTLASLRRGEPDGTRSVLDPLCGRGTTLSTAMTLGHDAAGVEIDVKAVEAYAAFLRGYLRRKRLKHRADVAPVRREGRSLGKRFDAEIEPPAGGRRLQLTVFSGDTRNSAALFGKRRFDAVVADAPYGVVHGSRTDVAGLSGRDRSAAALLGEAVPVWAGQLRTGGALGLSWNTLGLSRERLCALAVDAGLTPLDDGPYREFGHRVDSSIHRDILVAVRE